MNMRRWLGGLVAFCIVSGTAVAAESFYLVKTQGYDRKAEMVTMSAAEYKAYEQNIKLEQKYFSKAVSLVAKEWRADPLNKTIAFPGSRLIPRTIMGAQKFSSIEKADEQLSRFQDQEAKKAERVAERERQQSRYNRNASKGKSKAQESRDAELTRAADLVKAKLDDLISKGGGVGDAGPAVDVQAGGAGMGVGLGAGVGGAKVEPKGKLDAKGQKADKKADK
jgi:hypothetical protein